jgi:hypothetical protein
MGRSIRVLAAVALLATALSLVGCGAGRDIVLEYPAESLVFPPVSEQTPRLYVEFVNDLRPGTQREGEGGLATARFPADASWSQPVGQVYYQALVQDLTQTALVEVVPLRSQADYTLEIDLQHMGCKISRNLGGFALTGLAGAGLGYAVSGSGGGAAAGGVVGMAAIPIPATMRAVCQVRLRVYDAGRELFWERECLGAITKRIWEGMTSRKDQQWVNEYLATAVKRCNACLLGQLRQALVEAGEDLEAGGGAAAGAGPADPDPAGEGAQPGGRAR